ncbi:MAG: response regulator transcription factor [Anaerolineales bacterium]|nr:response regulator transcription factor [Anaerolineales bacterium]
MDKIKVLVVDDHPLFRQGVVDSFSLEPDIEVVGEAESGERALEIIRHILPQVTVLDVNLPGMNGQQITRQIVSERLPTRVILLTAYDDMEQVIHAMRVGAYAYSAKDVSPQLLVEIIRAVAEGYYYIEGQKMDAVGVASWLESKMDATQKAYSDPGEPFYPLSTREMEVLGCITQGLSNKEIALKLGISHQTVKNHVTAILRKLNVEDRTQAAVFALKRGWMRLHGHESSSEE